MDGGAFVNQWTWLHALFPLADIELTDHPIRPEVANVIVRTVRQIPPSSATGVVRYEVRVAPHPVAPFRGGPWIQQFSEAELTDPGHNLHDFRAKISREIESMQVDGGSVEQE